jgi:tRNA(adenine34) deaminase
VAVISQDSWSAPMRSALAQAALALAHGDVPIGAVLVSPSGEIVAAGHNRREIDSDATAHAEMLVLREASMALGSWRLGGYTLVVNLEPCPMCAMAAVWSRVERIVYGAADLKAGGVWSLYNIPQDARLNHRIEVIHGVLEQEASSMIKEFFEAKRDS